MLRKVAYVTAVAAALALPADAMAKGGHGGGHHGGGRLDQAANFQEARDVPRPLERDELRLDAFCLSMIFSENRGPLFRIML